MASKTIFKLLICMLVSATVSAQQPAPLFEGNDMNSGATVKLRDYRGKVVLIDFWASWCLPCLVSLPAYNRMRSQLDSDHFEIIAINVDNDTADGEDFLLDTPVDYPVLADPAGEIGIPYKIRSLPVSYLLDRRGNIVKTYKGFQPGDELRIMADIRNLIELQAEDSGN